jgi:membrane-associated protease RseP (regulator of RpoE activity)
MVALLSSLPLSLYLPAVGPVLPGFIGTIALTWVASWVALCIHELSHAGAARLLGVRIWGVRLGVGPALFEGIVAGCRLRVGVLPLMGSVALLDADALAIGYRDIRAGSWRFEWVPGAWRAPIISAAGGVGNLLCAFLVAGYWGQSGQPAFGTPIGDLCLFIFITNISGYLNLLPCFSSDGKHLLHHVTAARRRLAPRPSLS